MRWSLRRTFEFVLPWRRSASGRQRIPMADRSSPPLRKDSISQDLAYLPGRIRTRNLIGVIVQVRDGPIRLTRLEDRCELQGCFAPPPFPRCYFAPTVSPRWRIDPS